MKCVPFLCTLLKQQEYVFQFICFMFETVDTVFYLYLYYILFTDKILSAEIFRFKCFMWMDLRVRV